MTFPTDPATPEADAAGGSPGAAPATDQAGVGASSRKSEGRRRTAVPMLAGVLVAVIAGTTLFLSGWTLGRQAALTPGTPVTEAQLWQPFWDSYAAVTQRYAGGPVDREALVQGSIKGMIAALGDPFSQYLSPDQFKASLQGISGQFSGIGTTVGTVDASGSNVSCSPLSATCRLAIESTIPESPADKAGLRPGDVITSINGTDVTGLTMDQATQKIRGPKGSGVDLEISRAGVPPFLLSIVRANILQPEVSTKTLVNGAVGYIRLAGFSDQASIDFGKAVAADVAAGQKAIVIDLRGNGGGFVTAARDIASQFIPSGLLFWEQDAAGNLNPIDAESGGAATDPSIRVVVLVDGGTASASEIVTAALRGRGRATIVGTKTYGKATVQQWVQLENNSGGFRLTIERWLTPDKTWIHKVGITPDIVVTQQSTKPGQDPVLDAGLGALGYGNGGTGGSGGGTTGSVGAGAGG